MPEFITLARVGEIPDRTGRSFLLGDRRIALFRDGRSYFALADHCPHMGSPLATGDVRDGAVICDRHGWSFRLSDGVCREIPRLAAQTYALRIVGEEIQVRVESAPDDGSPAPATHGT